MGLFSGLTNAIFPDSSKEASRTLQNLQPFYEQQYKPYQEFGQQAIPTLQEQYSRLLNNPQTQWNNLAEGYQESPGYQFKLQQGQNAINNANAAGGSLGTNAHQFESAELAEGLADQDFYNYMTHILGLYGTGLEGTQGEVNTGFNATNALAGNVGNAMGSQAQLQYAGQNNQNQMIGGLAGLLSGGFSQGGWFR